MSFQVAFTKRAQRDAAVIQDWIAQRSRDGAVKWNAALSAAKDRLADSAESFPRAPESEAFDKDVRQVLFKTPKGNQYRALFTIEGNTVYVIAVRGFGQDLVTPDGIRE